MWALTSHLTFSLQIFNFHLKTWHVISDFGDDGNFYFPTNQEFLFGSFSDIQQILSTNVNFPVNDQCNVENICKYINNFQNAKLLLILKGPLESPLPSISFPVSVILYKDIKFSIEIFFQWSNYPSSLFYIIDENNEFNSQQTIFQKITYNKLVFILTKSLFSPSKSNITISFNIL